MGFQVEDGTGRGHRARVTDKNMLSTYSIIKTEIAYESEHNGRAYTWTATQNWGADKNVLWMRNDSVNQELHIERIAISCPAACLVQFFVGEGNTVGGVEVIGTNLNLASGNLADVTCRYSNTNVDGGTGMTLLGTVYAPALSTVSIEFLGTLLLPLNTEIAVNFVTDVDSSSVNLTGYFHHE
jgi:hypothetical protein